MKSLTINHESKLAEKNIVSQLIDQQLNVMNNPTFTEVDDLEVKTNAYIRENLYDMMHAIFDDIPCSVMVHRSVKDIYPRPYPMVHLTKDIDPSDIAILYRNHLVESIDRLRGYFCETVVCHVLVPMYFIRMGCSKFSGKDHKPLNMFGSLEPYREVSYG